MANGYGNQGKVWAERGGLLGGYFPYTILDVQECYLTHPGALETQFLSLTACLMSHLRNMTPISLCGALRDRRCLLLYLLPVERGRCPHLLGIHGTLALSDLR